MRSIFELVTYTLQLSTANTGLVITDIANITKYFQTDADRYLILCTNRISPLFETLPTLYVYPQSISKISVDFDIEKLFCTQM